MKDGSDAVVDWPILTRLLTLPAARGGFRFIMAAASVSVIHYMPARSQSPTAPTRPPKRLNRVLTKRSGLRSSRGMLMRDMKKR